MRLLHVHSFALYTFYGDAIPGYVIFSHTWRSDSEEVTFAQLESGPHWQTIPGARKIVYLCQQAAKDGYEWAWIDTCCINKSNNAELSQAINSMFRWYQNSAECYAYLADVSREPTWIDQDTKIWSINKSRWWTRAWTLQELLAPRVVRVFDQNWQELGTKETLSK